MSVLPAEEGDVGIMFKHTPIMTILNRGIILTGGGSMLKGLDQNIRERTNLPANMSERPLTDVVKGTGTVLMNIKKYTDVLM